MNSPSSGRTPLQGKQQKPAVSARESRWRDFQASLLEFWQEFRRIKYGIVGLILLSLFILIIILEPVISPFPEASVKWSDITYWDSTPKNAAPVWTNWLTAEKGAVHQTLADPEWKEMEQASFKIVNVSFSYNYQYDRPPADFIFRAAGQGELVLEFELVRPDGEKVRLLKKNLSLKNENRFQVPLFNEARDGAYNFARRYDSAENTARVDRVTIKPASILFARAEEGIFLKSEPLTGEYRLNLNAVVMGKGTLKEPELIISGRVFGLLGTDNAKRDIWSGVIAGTRWALFIGLLTAFVSVIIGVIYGVTSAYFGGWVDSAMMRIFEVFISIPILPVMIVLSAVFKPTIWIMIGLMCAFYWTGSVRTVRSMGLQIKEETYVEAAHALNASSARIIFKHMIPQLIPYSFASMALLVPSAIVIEASISLLGMGDATIVTWGQILRAAVSGGAVLQGLWWWVVPPGLCIALMGMTFAFIGFSMDKILNPKLKTR